MKSVIETMEEVKNALLALSEVWDNNIENVNLNNLDSVNLYPFNEDLESFIISFINWKESTEAEVHRFDK